MFKALVKKQLTEIFRSYFYNAKKNKARSKGSTILMLLLFVLLMAGFLGGVFAYLSYTLCPVMHEMQLDWLFFALMILLSILLGIFGSVFNTYSTLYLSKDNDLLLSMPIPPGTIVAARLVTVYLMGLMYSAVVLIPALVVYWIFVKISAGLFLSGLLLLLLVSVFVLLLSCLLGFVVAKVSVKLKNRSYVTVLISLLFIGGYYFFYFKASDVINDLLANAAVYGEAIKSKAYPVFLLGSIGVGNLPAILIYTSIVALLSFLTFLLLKSTFLSISMDSGSVRKAVYREKRTARKSVGSALLGRELKRFTTSASYMLNSGLGILFLLATGFAFVFKGREFLPAFQETFGVIDGFIIVMAAFVLCLMVSMVDLIAPSVSLEGKTIWIAQSLPVTPWQVLKAKLNLQLLMSVIPLAVTAVCVLAVIRPSAAQALLFLAVCLSYTLLYALFGLCIGLKMANLSWTSENTPIKQGGAVAITMFSGMGAAVAPMLIFVFIAYPLGAVPFMAICTGVYLVISLLLFLWLKGRGSEHFASL